MTCSRCRSARTSIYLYFVRGEPLSHRPLIFVQWIFVQIRGADAARHKHTMCVEYELPVIHCSMWIAAQRFSVASFRCVLSSSFVSSLSLRRVSVVEWQKAKGKKLAKLNFQKQMHNESESIRLENLQSNPKKVKLCINDFVSMSMF